MKYFLIILLFISCSKQQQEVKPLEQRFGGALPDNQKSVDRIPLLTSKGFIDVAQRGKPIKTSPVFISPTNGATVSGIVNISVTTGSIYINGVLVSSSTSYSWNTTGLASGFYTITAVAKGVSTSIVVFINTIIVEPPTETGVSLTMPPVLNQGSEGSCVAFSVGYAARSAEWFYTKNDTTTFSPEHLYNNVKFSEDCISGTAMQTALDWMVTNGILPYESMPYTSGTCSNTGTELQKQEALNYKIAGYYKIYTTDKAAIKSMIDSKHPVIISIAGDNSFIGAKAGFVWKVYSGSGYIAHSVVICGYDDTKNAYKIMNSWGTSWGDAGYSWIDYDFFPTRTGTWCYAIK